ncbi:MAG TPA: EamA/RhaT family transporter, partial [Daejeonella sp.]|nr:EamA/RhaT family transporter [Daejeonella sp.]
MIYIFLSICCSVFVSVLLKLAKRYLINIPQAVTWNYAVAAALCWYFYQPDLSAVKSNAYPLHLALGILLPSLFVILAASVRFTGIVRTDLAQRLSLFIPLLASFLIFSESLSGMKMAGIALGFIAIVCSIPWQKKTGFKTTSTGWFYLLIVFVGM